MYVKLVTPPLYSPVSLAAAYEHLRWDTETEMAGSPPAPVIVYPLETMVLRNIETSANEVEQITRRSLCERTLAVCARSFTEFDGASMSVELPMPPITAVVSVQYYNSANQLTAIAASNYFLMESVVPRLQFVTGFLAPTTYAREDAVLITYTAGYAPDYVGSPPTTDEALYTANIPAQLKDAVLMGVQLLSDRFDPVERNAMERARKWLLDGYMIWSV